MKTKLVLENVLRNFYSHCWYIPLICFLIGIKICLIIMLAETVVNPVIPHHSHNSVKRKRATTVFPKHLSTISQETINDWKTLENLEDSIIQPSETNRTDSNSIWLVYNRIPRTGGETLVNLLYFLSETNGFTHQEHEYRTPWPRFLVKEEQENLVTWFQYQHLPKSYDRHFYFVNFTTFQKYVFEKPVYINMVRDPVTRLKSYYIAKRSNSEYVQREISRRDKDLPGSGLAWYHRTFEECVLQNDSECKYETGTPEYTLSIPFFCGQHPNCVLINSKWALQRAKFTIEKYYSVVGLIEKWTESMTVLETYIPKFFQGLQNMWKTKIGNSFPPSSRNESNTSIEVRQVIENKLYSEVDLYEFINQRLDAQYSYITKRNSN